MPNDIIFPFYTSELGTWTNNGKILSKNFSILNLLLKWLSYILKDKMTIGNPSKKSKISIIIHQGNFIFQNLSRLTQTSLTKEKKWILIISVI